ncbi:hypothetical protein N9B48_00775, partial [bacterium]|nr:hypothetical protein [bacterium]
WMTSVSLATKSASNSSGERITGFIAAMCMAILFWQPFFALDDSKTVLAAINDFAENAEIVKFQRLSVG